MLLARRLPSAEAPVFFSLPPITVITLHTRRNVILASSKNTYTMCPRTRIGTRSRRWRPLWRRTMLVKLIKLSCTSIFRSPHTHSISGAHTHTHARTRSPARQSDASEKRASERKISITICTLESARVRTRLAHAHTHTEQSRISCVILGC